MNGLDLFSGIGGIGLALSPWVRTVAYCESDRYAQSVLLSRMQSCELDKAPIWDDVRTLRAEMLPEVDIIYGGFPCQDISVAGNGVGLGGQRSGLFQHIERLIKETNPRFVFLENVPAIRTRGLNGVAQSLTELGYDCRWTIVSAAEVGAPHIRKRWFLLAHSNGTNIREQQGRSGRQGWKSEDEPGNNGEKKSLANTSGQRLEGRSQSQEAWKAFRQHGCEGAFDGIHGIPQPTICRSNDGLPSRMDRVKCLGNSVVPTQAREAFMRLMGAA